VTPTEHERVLRRDLPLEALAATAALGILTWIMAPEFAHFPGALVPWPTHGLAIALLLGVAVRHRVLIGVALIVGTMVAGFANSGDAGRALSAATLLAGQTFLVVLLYDRLRRGAHPLASSANLAGFLVAVVIGTVPLTLLAALILSTFGADAAPGFTSGSWWVAAASSGAALAPLALSLTFDEQRQVSAPAILSVEFTLVSGFYVLLLLASFADLGPLPVGLPPAIATLPFLAWGGLRFGVRGFSLIASLLILAVSATATMDIGPFADFGRVDIERYRRAWVYLASLVGPAMIFPVALAERARAEQRTRTAHAQLTSIVESSSDLIAAVDRDLVVLAVNPAWVQEFQRISDVRVSPGMRMEEAFVRLPTERRTSMLHWRRALAGERFVSTREVGDPARTRDEYEISYGPVRDPDGEIVGASQVVRNVSERRRREAEDAEARRLESIGRLAGGIAHDFNNLMTAVMGYSDLVMQSLPAGDPRREDVAEIERAAGRAGELTQQLLAFARRRVIEPKLVDASALVEGFSRLLTPLIGPQVALVVRAARGLPLVRVDPTQFEQVVMNLAVNARDAMPRGGRLIIETAHDERDGEPVVRLSVRDSGSGMSADVQARIFEPFFTTKPLGEGTGLGLPTVHGIVHQAGGEIEVESTPDAGTAFHIYFPPAGARITPTIDGPMPPARVTPEPV
jgi:signal transduction histidine kinase